MKLCTEMVLLKLWIIRRFVWEDIQQHMIIKSNKWFNVPAQRRKKAEHSTKYVKLWKWLAKILTTLAFSLVLSLESCNMERAVLMILGKHGSYREVSEIFGFGTGTIHRAVRAVQEGRPIWKSGRPRHLLDDELERFFSLMRDHQGEKRLDYDAMQEEVTKKI